jgi:hypothetical protein
MKIRRANALAQDRKPFRHVRVVPVIIRKDGERVTVEAPRKDGGTKLVGFMPERLRRHGDERDRRPRPTNRDATLLRKRGRPCRRDRRRHGRPAADG